MTHKQYLRRVNTIEFGIQGVDKEEALAALERERMEDLDNHLDIDFVEAMDLGEFDEELEEEYGHLYYKNFILVLTSLSGCEII